LKDADRTVWTFASNDSLQQTSGNGTVSASLTCVSKEFSRNGLTLSIPFHVLDTQKGDTLVEAAFQWNLREIMSLSAGVSHAVGTIRCTSGETFQVSVLKQAHSREVSILSAGPTTRLIAHGKKTVETDMNPDNRMTAAVLLASIAIAWQIGPFAKPMA
jgi:hypothetical protein